MARDTASSSNVNTLWARIIADELARSGVRYAVISPGSRSTPLTIAFHEHPDISDISILDERSAAFFALGLGKQMGIPAVLICTSGTAAANYFPAVCEAHASHAPLLILSADRPVHLRESGAPQTMDQQNLYGNHAKWFADLPQPEADEFKLRALRSTMSFALARSMKGPAGPVHLNVQLRKPLEPTEVPEGHHAYISQSAKAAFGEGAYGRDGGVPFTEYLPVSHPTMEDTGPLLNALRTACRPLILVGPDPQGGVYADALIVFAEAAGIPVFAEGLSNVRFTEGEHPLLVGCADIMLRSEVFKSFCAPDLIIRTGAAPTNKMLQDFVEAHAAIPQMQIGETVRRTDPAFVTSRHVVAHPEAVFEILQSNAGGLTFEEGWAEGLSAAAAAARTALAEAIDGIDVLCEAGVMHEVSTLLPGGTAVMLSNSMPVRDWETYAQATGKRLETYCNRGVNGIDGVTSTALGIARARGKGTVLVTGDLAFLHDLNGLWAARGGDINATIVVVNNNGGEIFGMLPVRNFDPPFEKHFSTPHNMDLAKAGELFGLEFYKAMNAYQLQTFLNISLDAPGVQIIEVPTDRANERALRKRIADEVTAALETVVAPSERQEKARVYSLHTTRIGGSGSGEQTPALMLHGFTRSVASWKSVVQHLEASRAMYAADLMGHGASPSPRFEDAPDAYSLEYQCSRLEERIAACGIGKLHLAGYSMGGRTALLYALEHPERIASLTLISASPGVTGAEARAARKQSDTALADSIVQNGLEAFVDRWASSEIVSGGLDDAARANGRLERLSQRAEGLRGSLLGMGQGVQPDLWDRLAEVQCPVLLVAGSADEKYVDVMSRMKERISGAQFHVLESTGHDCLSAAPAELAALIGGFWNACDSINR